MATRNADGKNPSPTRTRMIGKRELIAHGVRDEAKIGEYLSLPENKHRRVSGKTAYKVCRKWLKK